MTYLSHSLRYAVIYALGGSILGSKPPESFFKDEPNGYLFVVDGDDLKLQPDEDELGHIARTGYRMVHKGEKFHQDMDSPVLCTSLEANPSKAIELYRLADYVLTANQKERLFHGYDYDICAVAGKKLVKVMSASLKQEFVNMGCHVASSNPVIYPIETWMFEKKRSEQLDYHAVNFFELATKLPTGAKS